MIVLLSVDGKKVQVEIDDDIYNVLYRKGGDALVNYCKSLLNSSRSNHPSDENIEPRTSQTPQEGDKADYWDEKKIKLLLTLRLGREAEFIRPTCKKSKLWISIASEFNSKGYEVSARDLEKKYNNLKQTYIRNKEKTRQTGESAPSWPYFHLFDEILGNKASIQPPPETIGDILNESSSSSFNEPTPSTSSATAKRRRNRSDEELELKKEKFKWQKEKFEILVKLEQEKIKAIQELTETIRNKNQ